MLMMMMMMMMMSVLWSLYAGCDDDRKLRVDFKSISCKVCNAPSSGFHFGAITCEGCKVCLRTTLCLISSHLYVSMCLCTTLYVSVCLRTTLCLISSHLYVSMCLCTTLYVSVCLRTTLCLISSHLYVSMCLCTTLYVSVCLRISLYVSVHCIVLSHVSFISTAATLSLFSSLPCEAGSN